MPKITISTNNNEVVRIFPRIHPGLGGERLLNITWRECERIGVAIEGEILAALQEAEEKDNDHLSHAEQVAEREMIQAQQPVVNEEGSC